MVVLRQSRPEPKERTGAGLLRIPAAASKNNDL
jgi:hypothetical protein